MYDSKIGSKLWASLALWDLVIGVRPMSKVSNECYEKLFLLLKTFREAL